MTADNHDPVTNPSHYTSGGKECIDVIREELTAEEFLGYCKGCFMKYHHRAGKKPTRGTYSRGYCEDLRKADWYERMGRGDDPRKDSRADTPDPPQE